MAAATQDSGILSLGSAARMEAQSPPPAPAVVAVLVTHDPGPWLESALESLRLQDYPNMSALVIDAGSREDPTAWVAAVFPDAYVRRLDGPVSFGIAANEVMTMVEGASHYLVCHDDVTLDPDALRLLVEEAYRSNAGIAAPKYVDWDDPARLLAVGATTDRVGVLRPMVEPGELDQGQHDVVREVLVAPGGATLLRTDLFSALSGFDAMIEGCGEDVDLSWRARLVGARVIVVPAAKVRHLEATRSGRRPGSDAQAAIDSRHRKAEANRLRTLITCYRWFDLLWALPLAVAWLLGEARRTWRGAVEARAWPHSGLCVTYGTSLPGCGRYGGMSRPTGRWVTDRCDASRSAGTPGSAISCGRRSVRPRPDSGRAETRIRPWGVRRMGGPGHRGILLFGPRRGAEAHFSSERCQGNRQAALEVGRDRRPGSRRGAPVRKPRAHRP